jgi:YihY family inner membrane protein
MVKRLINKTQHVVHDSLLRYDMEGGKAHRFFVRSYRLMYYTVRSRKLHRTFVDSAALTLQTMIAAIPLLAFMLIIMRLLGTWENTINSIYENFDEWRSLVEVVVEAASVAADKIPGGFFAIVGLGTLLWMIFIVFRAVEESFNHIWGVRESRGFVKRYVSYIAVAVIVPVLWGLSTTFRLDSASWFELSSDISAGITRVLSIVISAFATSLLYKYLPHAEVRWRYAMAAAALVSCVLVLWQWGYVYVQVYMTGINTIYGSLAAVPLFIVWLRVSWNVILFGCELCCVWQNAARYEAIDQRRLGFKARRKQALMRVVVIGSGNVAEAFAMALKRCRGVELVQLFARNEARGKAIAERANTLWTNRVEDIAEADIYIIAVSDRAVEEVAKVLCFSPEATVVHTAGSIPMEAIEEREGGRGIIYPLQSFSAGRSISLDAVPLFIEADSERSRERVEALAKQLSSRVAYATSESRRTIHLAGVIANNFVNHLYATASDIVAKEGLDFDVLKPLIIETAQKAVASGDPRTVQTGPASRGDMSVCDRHVDMLREDEIKQQIYKHLTESIWETSKKI